MFKNWISKGAGNGICLGNLLLLHIKYPCGYCLKTLLGGLSERDALSFPVRACAGSSGCKMVLFLRATQRRKLSGSLLCFPCPLVLCCFFPLDKDGNQRPLSLLALLGCVAVRLMFQLCSDVNQGGSEEQEGEHEAAKIITHWSVLPAFLLQEVLVGSSLDLLTFLPCLSRWYSLQNPHTLEGGQSLFQPLPRSSLPVKL